MRSGLNGRRINRLAVNATYREHVHGEASLALALDADLEGVIQAAALGEAVLAISDETAGSATVSPGSEGTALIDLSWIASATVSPGSDGVAVVDLRAPADPAVFDNAEGAGMAELTPRILGTSSALDVVRPTFDPALIAMPTGVSPLAIPLIPATDAVVPFARGIDMGHREALFAEAGQRDLRVENVRDEALEVESDARESALIAMPTGESPLVMPAMPASYTVPRVVRHLDIGHRDALVAEAEQRDPRVENVRDEALGVEEDDREFEIADSRREIEVRHKRRMEP